MAGASITISCRLAKRWACAGSHKGGQSARRACDAASLRANVKQVGWPHRLQLAY